MDPGGQTRPEIGLKFDSFGFAKYIIGLNPNLNPILGQPNLNQPEFWVPNPQSIADIPNLPNVE